MYLSIISIKGNNFQILSWGEVLNEGGREKGWWKPWREGGWLLKEKTGKKIETRVAIWSYFFLELCRATFPMVTCRTHQCIHLCGGWACPSPEGSAQAVHLDRTPALPGQPASLPQQRLSSRRSRPRLSVCNTEQYADPIVADFRACHVCPRGLKRGGWSIGVCGKQLRVLAEFADSCLKTIKCISMEHWMLHAIEF